MRNRFKHIAKLRLDSAQKMLAKGVGIDLISSLTGLSLYTLYKINQSECQYQLILHRWFNTHTLKPNLQAKLSW